MAFAAAFVRDSVAGLPRAFWYLWLGTLINRLGIFISPFLTLFLTSQRGLTVEEATFLISIEGLGSFTSQLSGGFFCDRFGRRITMLISFFVSPILMLLLYQPTNTTALAVLIFFYGFFIDLYRPASAAMIADVVPPKDRVRAYSLRYWAINLGAAIALSMAGFLATRGYLLLFVGDAITTFGFGLIVLFLISETAPNHHSTSDQTTPPAPFSRQELPILIFCIIFSLLGVCMGAVMLQSNVTLPLAMKADGLSEADYGLAVSFNGLVIVLVSLPLNQYLTRFSRFTVLALGMVAGAVGFGLNAVASTFPVYVFAVIIWTLGELIMNPVGPAIIADISPAARRGFYQGLFGASWGLASFFGPMFGGIIYQRLGSDALWLTCLIVGLGVAGAQLTIVKSMFARLKGLPYAH